MSDNYWQPEDDSDDDYVDDFHRTYDGWPLDEDDYTDADAEPMPDFGLTHDPMDAETPMPRPPDYVVYGGLLGIWVTSAWTNEPTAHPSRRANPPTAAGREDEVRTE